MKQSKIKLILLSLWAIYLVKLLTNPLFMIFPVSLEVFYESAPLLDKSPLIYQFITVSVLSPVLETFLFQFLPIKICYYFTSNRTNPYPIILPMVISSLIFSAVHWTGYESIAKMVQVFFIGLVFAYTYIVAFLNERKPFLIVALVHGVFNMSGPVFIWGYLFIGLVYIIYNRKLWLTE